MTAVAPISRHTVRPMAPNTMSGSSSGSTAKFLKKSSMSSLCACQIQRGLTEREDTKVLSLTVVETAASQPASQQEFACSRVQGICTAARQ